MSCHQPEVSPRTKVADVQHIIIEIGRVVPSPGDPTPGMFRVEIVRHEYERVVDSPGGEETVGLGDRAPQSPEHFELDRPIGQGRHDDESGGCGRR